MPTPPIESVAVQAVTRLVSLRHGCHVRIVSLVYKIQHPLGLIETVELQGFPLCLSCGGEAVRQDGQQDEPAEIDDRTEPGLRGEILAMLREVEKPLKGSAIARRLGRNPDSSHFRSVLARLRREGKLDHYEGRGYWLTDREPPPDVQG